MKPDRLSRPTDNAMRTRAIPGQVAARRMIRFVMTYYSDVFLSEYPKKLIDAGQSRFLTCFD
jgi:hypothetical protein